MTKANTAYAPRMLYIEGRSEELIHLHQGLTSPTPEDDYWAGFAYATLGNPIESEAMFERSFRGGYLPAAALLASYAQEAKENERAHELLDLLEPFDELQPWDRGIAYRERGKLLEATGQFPKAKIAYQKSWDILHEIADAQILLGFAGQLLSWNLELFNQSQSALNVVREAKKYSRANRRVQLLYLQILTAAQTSEFNEAHEALIELEMFVPANPRLQGHALQAAGVLARLEGRWLSAIEHFESTAAISKGLQTETYFWANLFASHCSHALGDKAGALAYLDKAEGEFFSIDPFLAPAYSARAQANLSLRRGALEASLGKLSALDHLENARQIFAELGLPLGQCLALLHLAGWYAREFNTERAVELLGQSEALRKEVQDIGSYEAELVLLPQLKPIFERLEYAQKRRQIEATRSAQALNSILVSEKKRTLAEDLRRLVISGSNEEAVSLFEQANKPSEVSRGWAGLAKLLLGDVEAALGIWTVAWEHPFRQQFEQLRAMSSIAAEDPRFPVQLITIDGRTETLLLRAGRDTPIHRERVVFKQAQTAKLLSMLLDHHGQRDNRSLSLSQILRVLWKHLPEEVALEEFEGCCAEIETLGKRLGDSLPRFAVRKTTAYDTYQLVDPRFSPKEQGRDIRDLPIISLALEPDHLGGGFFSGFAEIIYFWMLQTPELYAEDSGFSSTQRSKLENNFLEIGLKWIKHLEQEHERDTALMVGRALLKLEAQDPFLAVNPSKEELFEVIRPLGEERYIRPGGLKIQARVKQDARILERLERELHGLGWRMRRLTDERYKRLADHERLDAELDSILGIEAIPEEDLELICTKLFPEIALEDEMHAVEQKLQNSSVCEFNFVLKTSFNH